MQAKIVDVPNLKLVGSRITTGAFAPEIAKLWNQFVPHINSIPKRAASGDSFGICVSPESANADVETFEYTASVLVDEFVPAHENYVKLVIPGGQYAVFTHHGDLSKLPESWAAMSLALDSSGIKVDNSLVLELYDERFNPMSPKSEIDLLIPVKN